MQKVSIIKVGGAVLEDPASLHDFLCAFAKVEGKKVLVHGGGRTATSVAAQLGVETHMVGGRRVTDSAMLDIVTMVYGGLVNKRVVVQLQAMGVNALGLTGADGDIIRSHKRPVGEVDYGFVGDVEKADGELLAALLDKVVPVVAPLTHDGNGLLLNTNADTMAQTAATALAPRFDVTLVYCFEKPGVLTDADNDDSVIPILTPSLYAQYKADGTVSGGMLPKLDNAFAALAAGVNRVVITSFRDMRGGTTITTD